MDASKTKSKLKISLGVFIVCVLTGIFNALQRTVAKNLSHINPAVWTSCHFLVIWCVSNPQKYKTPLENLKAKSITDEYIRAR